MDSKNAHSTVLKGPQLMNSFFVLNSIPASGSGKTCLPWVCAATLGSGAPERRRSKSGEPRADSEASQKRSVSLIKACYKTIGQRRLCVPDDTTSRPSTTNNILLSALLARHIHFGCSVAAQRRPEGQMEKQIQKAPDEIQFNSEMKQKLPTNANTARIPLLFGNYFWEMLVEETARSRPCGLHNSDPHILVGKILYQSIPLIRNHMQYVLLFSLQAAYQKKFKKCFTKRANCLKN